MFVIHAPKEVMEETLLEAGYVMHPTGDGFIRELDMKRRYHAHIENNIDVHFDITVNGFHKVLNSKHFDLPEKSRLRQARKRVLQSIPKVEKVKIIQELERPKRNIIAKDLYRIQKEASQLNKWNNPIRNLLIKFKVI